MVSLLVKDRLDRIAANGKARSSGAIQKINTCLK